MNVLQNFEGYSDEESYVDEECFDLLKLLKKMKGKDYKLFNGNVECKMIIFESFDNFYVVFFMMNCQEESVIIISKVVFIGI